jgi:hypothetical protein
MKLTRHRIIAALAIAVAGWILAPGVALLWNWQDIHPRNVTRFLLQIEQEYRAGNPSHRGGMLEYVEDHYRYEDMPEFRNSPVAEELARQRQRTMDAILEWERARP